MKIIASGIDTLVIGFSIDNYKHVEDFDVLVDAKAKAAEKKFDSKGCGVEWFGVEFNMKPRGAMGCEWVMNNADITIRIAREARGGLVMPEVYIRFSSQNLWANGVERAFMNVINWLSRWAVIKDLKVSQLDLCIDVEMEFPKIDIKSEVVSRARLKAEYSEPVKAEHYVSCRRDTGYKFGAGDLCARIYDKTYEITVSQKEWMREVWTANGWDGKTQIIRYEFQCRRNFLKEMSVNSFDDLNGGMADIWRYCTNDWLRVCDCGSNTNQSRWESKDYWMLIQRSFNLFGQTYGVLRMKAKQVSYEHLLRQIRGCAVSGAAALGSGVGVTKGMYRLKEDLESMLISEDFKADVIKRKGSMCNMGRQTGYLVDAAVSMGAEIEND